MKEYWTKWKAWLLGLSGIITVIILILTQVLDFVEHRVVQANAYPDAAEIKEITNNEVVERVISELNNIKLMIVIQSKKSFADTLINTRVQPSQK